MNRREFLNASVGAGVLAVGAPRLMADGTADAAGRVIVTPAEVAPMALGLIVRPGENPEEEIAKVSQLGLTNCFLSLDDYIGKFTEDAAKKFEAALQKYKLTATCAEVVGPGRLVWDFLDGPATIGIEPRESRAARVDA